MQKHTFTSVAEVSRLAILQSVIASGRVALGAVLNMGCPETAEMAEATQVWISSGSTANTAPWASTPSSR